MSFAEPSIISGLISIVYLVFVLGYLGVGVYCTVLFVKLAVRGIKALDIYLGKPRINDMNGER